MWSAGTVTGGEGVVLGKMPLRAQYLPQQGPKPRCPGKCHLQVTRALHHLLWAPCLVPCGVFSPIVSLVARTVLPSGSVVVNSCSSVAEQLCNFICDCSDCSDENQCGYLRDSAVLGTPFTCDFEDSDCGWQDVGTSMYGWVRGRASLAMWGMGPHSDHTVGTDLGWFLVTMSPPAKTTATAWLRSPEMREAAATCEIRAWYHLSGSCESTQGLNQTERPVLRLAVAHKDEVVELWQSPEHSSEGWHQLVAYPGRIMEQFQLIFSLTQPPTCGAEVALDDIMFRNCGLPENFTQCSFDYDLCDWEMAAGPPVWGRNTSLNLGTSYSIPTRDHSNNSRAGFFLHVSSDPNAQAGGTAQLSSPTFQATNSCSLVLYCHLHGSATSNLSISYVTNSTKHLMRERTGDLGSCWVRERVDFNVTDPFKVLIEGVAGSGGTVAIDDLILSQGCVKEQEKPLVTLPSQAGASPCAADEVACDSGDCIAAELACDFADTCADGSDEKRCGTTTFESGAGGWHDVSVGQLRWGLQKVTESDIFLTGTFLALQTGEGQMVGPAKARSPPLGPSGPSCTMEMSYNIHSDPQGFLAISVADHTTGTTQLVWQTQHRGSTAGGHVRVPLGERSRAFQVELLALVDLQGSASVGVDNVTFEQCYLDVVSPTAAGMARELSCNFERGMCGWYQDLSSDFKWVHSTGQGQGSDHTTGSGYFLSVDSSVPWSHGQRAQLLTSLQEPAAAPRCLSFWYRLAGPQIGTLNLKLWPEGGEEVVLWTCRGTQGSLWHRAWATLPSTGQQRYQVAFEVLHDGFLGDVGLDDITQTAGPCGAKLSCSFEVEGCGLAASGKGTWQRQSNSTGTTAGPVADHTTGTSTGHYMVVNTGRVSLPAGHTATLTSQPYQPSVSAQCLAFWYQLSAGTPGSLRVFVEQSRVRRKVLSMSTMEGSNWHRSHVTVQPNGEWQVVFEAVGAGGDHGYIALDDLHMSEGACPKPASCDFEQGTCGWSSPSDPRLHSFAWGWKSGITLAKYPGPEQDHTLGTRNGHYMHFDTSVLGARGTSALLESPPLPAATDSCLRFWYHMDIPEHLSSGELRVTLHGTTGQRTVWSVAGHRSRGWQGAVVPVQSPSEFQISFEISTRRWPMEGTVALDDIMYSTRVGCHCSPESPVEGAGKLGQGGVCSSGCERSTQSCPGCWAEAGGRSLGSGSSLTAFPPPAEKPSSSFGSFVAEVVLGVLLAVVIVALVAAGGWYWLKQRRLASRTLIESNSSQGFDNITFRDDKVIISSREGDQS
ncbi:apical endosomal glycoprotein isoform X3 [Anomalospiza imberbis]|uniref:apical endosomal glycoprotein isoform X3 n=1 Tax=Anomalospiza imberbis TaxID=187417 RepID=UPI00358E6B7D